MTKNKFELFITCDNKQHVFEVGSDQILLGSAPNCHVYIDDSKPPIKAAFWVEDNALVVKIFDLNYPIKINGKKYKTAKLLESLFFKLGSLDIILSVEEIADSNILEGSIEDEFEEEFDQTLVGVSRANISTDSNTPELPEILSDTDVVETQTQQSETPSEIASEKVSVTQGVVTEVPLSADINDIVSFDRNFQTDKFQPLGFESYSHPDLDFSDYIDPLDETVGVEPLPDLIKPKKGFSIHFIQMDNGTTLDEKFFASNHKRIYISETLERKNFFKAHGTGFDKQEIAFVKGDHVSVVGLKGFRMAKIAHSKALEINTKTAQLLPGEKIILTKDTTQIIVRLADAVPLVKDANYFNFDDDMLKSIAYAWVFALFVLINVLVSETPVKEEKKKVVIYKVKKKESPKKEVVKVPDQPKPAASEQKVEEKSEPAPKPKTPKKEVAKIEPVKSKVVEPVKKPVKKPKVVAKPKTKSISRKKAIRAKVAQKPAPKPAPKKEYKFDFANKMASSLNSSTPTALKSAKKSGSLNVNNVMDSRTAISSGSVSDSKLGTSNVKVGRMAASRATGTSKMLGTKGLSGKTKSNTAYMEAKTKVLGSLDPALIRKIMREHIPAFRYCYQQELLENGGVAGVFDVNFQINATGKGVKTYVKSKGKGFSRKGLTCIKRVVSRIKFPRPKGGGYVDVRQPMNFYTN